MKELFANRRKAMLLNWRYAVTAVMFCATLAGCGKGYPTDGGLSGELTASELVKNLNKLSEDVAKEMRHTFSMADACVLSLVPATQSSGIAVEVPLLTLAVSVKKNTETDMLTVSVQDRAQQSRQALSIYETSIWHEAAAFQSHLSQLRGICADTRVPGELV